MEEDIRRSEEVGARVEGDGGQQVSGGGLGAEFVREKAD